MIKISTQQSLLNNFKFYRRKNTLTTRIQTQYDYIETSSILKND